MQAEKQSGRRLMPILQYRFGQGIQKLKMLADEGVTGQPYLSTAEVAWRRGADYYAVPWRGKWATELGGTLLSHAIHALDLLVFIAGPVDNVYARTATLVNPIEVEDCASISFAMANGSLASLSVTMGSTPEITRHRFCFSSLTAESDTRPYTSSDDPWTSMGLPRRSTSRLPTRWRALFRVSAVSKASSSFFMMPSPPMESCLYRCRTPVISCKS